MEARLTAADSMHRLHDHMRRLLARNGFTIVTFHYSQSAGDEAGTLSVHADRDVQDTRDAVAHGFDQAAPTPKDSDYPVDLAEAEPVYDFSGSISGSIAGELAGKARPLRSTS